MGPNVLITTGDSRVGFQTAIEFLGEKIYNRVVVGFRNAKIGKDLENIGAIAVDLKPENSSAVESVIRDHQIGHMYIIPPSSDKRVEHTKAYIAAASKSHMRCVVLMSVVNCSNLSLSQERDTENEAAEDFGSSMSDFAACERFFTENMDKNWCILRQSLHQQNLLVLADIVQNRGHIPLPTANGKTGLVNLKDCAVAASAILRTDDMNEDYKRKTFNITGPESVNGLEIAKIAGDTFGRHIKFEHIHAKEMYRILSNISGLNKCDIQFLMDYFWATRTGKMDFVSPDYKYLTGMEGQRLVDFFKENGDQFQPGHGP